MLYYKGIWFMIMFNELNGFTKYWWCFVSNDFISLWYVINDVERIWCERKAWAWWFDAWTWNGTIMFKELNGLVSYWWCLMSNDFISLWHVTYNVKWKHVHDDFIAQSMVHEHGLEKETMKEVIVPQCSYKIMKGVRVPHTYEGGWSPSMPTPTPTLNHEGVKVYQTYEGG